MDAQGAPLGTNGNQPAFSGQKEVLSQHESSFENPSSNVKFEENFGGENLKAGPFSKMECASEIGRGSKTYVNYGNIDMKVDKSRGSGELKTFTKVNGKKARKQVVESSESYDTGNSSDTDEDVVVEEGCNLQTGKNFVFHRVEYPQRSTRHKQQFSYEDSSSDDEIPWRKAKGKQSSCAAEEETEDALLEGEASKMNNRAGLAADVKKDEKGIKQKDGESGVFKTFRKINGKRAREQAEESSESWDSGSSTDAYEDEVIEECGSLQSAKNFRSYGEGCLRRSTRHTQQVSCKGDSSDDEIPRRSTRHKQQVSYKEDLSDNEIPWKKVRGSGSFCAAEEETEDALLKVEASKMNNQAGLAADVKKDEKDVKQKEGSSSDGSTWKRKKETKKVNGKQKAKEDDFFDAYNHSMSSSSPEITPDPELYECPDPDFSDFDKDREEKCFKVGQIWAVYDTLDTMPRFYARIRKAFFPGFKLQITWLEPDPDDEDEIKWTNKGLPISCGKFQNGFSEYTEDRLMFSHLVFWEKGSSRDSYMIYPRRGETWALFKNWDIKWSSDPDSNRKYEFEIVEVLSDYAEGVGTCVAYLGKVEGFVSVFFWRVKEGTISFQIPQGELYRFSHKVPSFKMTGEERIGVPKGSFELDPASLPTNLDAVIVPEGLKAEANDAHLNGSCSKSLADEVKPMMESAGSAATYQADEKETYFDPGDFDSVIDDPSAPLASTPEPNELPEPEFYDFNADKSVERFQVGQIWALYSDEDGLPKYYGQIEKINSRPDFKLHLTSLQACWPCSWQDNSEKKMPFCCGRFKIGKHKSKVYTSATSFSHKLRAECAGKNEYVILPRKGEVWALYKRSTTETKRSDSEDCEYDIVEVLEENDLQIKVLVLERVDGFNSVFKGQVKGGSTVTMEIPRVELLKFSHQIPAFRLTKEKGGSLRGFWELDPAAVPVLIFCSD